jgi:prefoldin subunit 5
MRFSGWGATPTSVDESAMLKAQADQLQAQLDAVQQRLSELNNE